MEFLKGYKTVIFNTATVLAGLAEMIGVINLVAPGSDALILLIVGVANLILRYMTTTPVFNKTQEKTPKE